MKSLCGLGNSPSEKFSGVPAECLESTSLLAAENLGGFPRGRIVLIHGMPKHGKTSVLLKAIATTQRAGGECVYVDAEHKLSLGWAKYNGVNLDDLTIITPPHGEMAIDAAEKLALTGADIVVIDSIAALVPRAEIDGQSGDSFMGVMPRLLAQAMRKLCPACAKSGTTLMCIAQSGANLSGFGSPNTVKGGKAVEYYSSIVVEVKKLQAIKDGDEQIGIKSQIYVKENQIAIPYEKCEFDIYTGKNGRRPGIDVEADLLDSGIAAGVVEKSGMSYSFRGEIIGRGRGPATDLLFENLKFADALREAILKVRLAQ